MNTTDSKILSCEAPKKIQALLSVVAVVSKVVSPLWKMCYSPVEQKWNSTSAIIEQQGAKEVFELERRNKWEEWAKMCGLGEKLRND